MNRNLKLLLPASLLFASLLSITPAQAQSGVMTGGATKLPPITLSSGMPLSDATYELESGKYYSIEIIGDGSAELAISGATFFRNVWINEVVINDIEVRPLGLDSLEFDAAGTARISFVAIRPGTYEVRIPGTTGDTQKATFVIR